MKFIFKAALAITIGMCVATSAYAATAFWTGKQEMVQTVTFKMAWKCEYNYNGQLFSRIFENSCPATVEVE